MKRSRFTEDQIIGILKEHEAGVGVTPKAIWQALRKLGVTYKSEEDRI